MTEAILCDMRIASPILLSEEERAVLRTWTHGRSLPLRLVQRAQIVAMAAEGIPSQDIAQTLEVSRPTVQLWRERFLALRLEGLKKDAPRPGRIPSLPQKKVRAVVQATLHTTPRGATHWSIRTMAKAQGISRMAVQRIWDRHGLKPHLTKTFKLSRDQRFVEKLYDVVGLYLNPPDKALVLCVDEKSQIQALDRTQPGLPIKKGRCGTMTHDYKRHGTTTLFAALSMLDGKVIGDCMPRHRHQEWIKFLNLIDQQTPNHKQIHLIADNYATHKHPKVLAWLKRHPRFHMHFTPTSASWLNMVERFFRDLTTTRLKRGVFTSVQKLVAAIESYIAQNNQSPKPFIWTAKASDILEKVKLARESLHKSVTG